MDEDTRRRCLEPFYTTKGERGTGLGLAMVYGMIQRHSAELDIESAAGRGTTVRLSFPADTSSLVSTTRQTHPAVVVRRLRILLVDDDPMLIKSLQDTLQDDGHVITATHGGQAGIDAFAAGLERVERFDVVITDLGMPYVDGRKVAASIKTLSAATPVILLTGWGQLADYRANDIPAHIDKVLSKPHAAAQVALRRHWRSSSHERHSNHSPAARSLDDEAADAGAAKYAGAWRDTRPRVSSSARNGHGRRCAPAHFDITADRLDDAGNGRHRPDR